MKKILIILLTGMLFFVVSCKKPDDSCDEEKLTAAFVFGYPDSVQVGQTFDLYLDYIVENSCGDFGRFEGTLAGNTLEVRLKTYYKGCNCVEKFEEKSVNYPITFEEPGTYELKFWVAENEFETYVIVAEE